MLSDMLSLCHGEPLGFGSVAGCSAASRVLLAWRKGKKGDGGKWEEWWPANASHAFVQQTGSVQDLWAALGRTLTDRLLYKGQSTRQGNGGSAGGIRAPSQLWH